MGIVARVSSATSYVSMKPGNTELIRIPAFAYWSAKSFTKAPNPALSAEETGKEREGSTAPKAEMATSMGRAKRASLK